MSDSKRELGVIEDAKYYTEDHGFLTCSIGIAFKGSYQSFGNLALNDTVGPDFIKSICEVFEVKKLEYLVGKQCYALRSFSKWSEPIEGLEAMNGKRFTITAWRKKHFPNAMNVIEEKIKYLECSLENLIRRQSEIQNELHSLSIDYIDWEV